VSNYDFVPTLLGYLGLSSQLPAEPASPGRDYSNILKGDKVMHWRNEVFAEFEYLRMIRTEDWKLIRRFAAGPDELYNLAGDPTEEHNLISQEASQETLRGLDQRLEGFFNRYAAKKFDLWQDGGSQTLLLTKPSGSVKE
jgi:arylsulfatase A-like enzyme